jgi:hypothetical protein
MVKSHLNTQYIFFPGFRTEVPIEVLCGADAAAGLAYSMMEFQPLLQETAQT